MTGQSMNQVARLSIPEPRRAVIRGGNDTQIVGREFGIIEDTAMTTEGVQWLSCAGVPNACCGVGGGRDDASAIG